MNIAEHKTVLAEETVNNVLFRSDGYYIDATFGRGGHSRRLLDKLNQEARLLVMDKDHAAIAVAESLAQVDQRVVVRQGSYTQLSRWATELGWIGKVSGVVLDLGVSSPQIDDAGRGFSFQVDGPLDMRMDQEQGLSAAELLATVSESDLADILFNYGEERYARRIARALVAARLQAPLTSTLQVAAIIRAAHPAWDHHKHPATKSFQALRLYVNQELEELDQVLPMAVEALEPGGRLAVISFHSLEDRRVKQFMRDEVRGVEPPSLRGLPVAPAMTQPRLRQVIRRQDPSEQEIAENPRSRSAHLRVAERLS